MQIRFDLKAPDAQLAVYDEVVIDTTAEAAVSTLKLQLNLTHSSESNLFAMSSNILKRVPVHDCGKHITCKECARSGDPFCVWYTLVGKFVHL